MTEDLKTCPHCGEPVVFTFEFRGAEWYCVVCRKMFDLFGVNRSEATTERQLRLDDLTERYQRERAERQGTPLPASTPKVGDAGSAVPVCTTCGRTPVIGLALVDGKPRAWYSQTTGDVREFACSSSCIPKGTPVLPW